MASTSVEIELAVRNLVARYGDAVCRRHEGDWAATWAEDCEWQLDDDRITHGRDATVALWRTSIAKYAWVAQLPTSGVITVDDSGVRGTWYIQEFNHRVDGTAVMHLGRYLDTYVETAEGWQFASRRLHMMYRGAMDVGRLTPLPS